MISRLFGKATNALRVQRGREGGTTKHQSSFKMSDARINFPAEEEKVLALWKRLNAFERSLELSKGKPEVSHSPTSRPVPSFSHTSSPAVHVLRRPALCNWPSALWPHPCG
jgi:hypothetical protein